MNAARRAVALAALAVLPMPAHSGPGTPGPAYFTGLYDRIGRDDAAGLVNDHVRLEPAGQALSMLSCGAAPLTLVFAPWSLGENFVTARIKGGTMVCQFHNDGDNHPIFTCQSDTGARMTLWPADKGFRTAALDCKG